MLSQPDRQKSCYGSRLPFTGWPTRSATSVETLGLRSTQLCAEFLARSGTVVNMVFSNRLAPVRDSIALTDIQDCLLRVPSAIRLTADAIKHHTRHVT